MAARKPAASGRLSVAKTYKIYIDGKFPRTESGRYFALEDKKGGVIANVCRGSRKDFRNAVVAADIDPGLPAKLRSEFPALSNRRLKQNGTT